ncbi:hypothetical protein [Halothermothrix orenii]|uniref:hypothetical protein n=1 Tax=Halothermothrix orenii TaxID=31909 RepID=UPI00006BEBC0|nr:hypothetical protein [Halothermothrix orenii]
MDREPVQAESRRHRHDYRRGNSCTNNFRQELLVDFEVTFNVDIDDVNITDVQCPGR